MFYVSLMETTNQMPTVDTQKIKKSKHSTTENHQITKEECIEETIKQTENIQ